MTTRNPKASSKHTDSKTRGEGMFWGPSRERSKESGEGGRTKLISCSSRDGHLEPTELDVANGIGLSSPEEMAQGHSIGEGDRISRTGEEGRGQHLAR